MRHNLLSAVTLAAALIAAPAVCFADYAMVLTSTLCQNQYDAMNVVWARTHPAGPGAQKLFYFDGTNFTAVGHTAPFDSLSEVVISAHGNKGSIGPKSAADFATAFLDKHAATPNSVTLLTCYSATGSTGKSVMGALAAKYPSAGPAGTLVANLYGSKVCSALRKPASGPAAMISEAIYYDGVVISEEGKKIVTALVDDWTKKIYPGLGGKDQTFASYCTAVLSDVTALPDFITAVDGQYGARYLELINDNGGGSSQTRCGAAEPAKVCD
ncbi:hypothetical protein [Azorhizobium caulinodans]|uniref:hypothetical protein n=1 Tax=Azorhizobium caulinodans TaxID=7 RepID=UPI002FBD9724